MGLKENLKSRRLELKLTLDDVASKIGIGRSTLHKYENGIISNIPFDKLEKIAVVLNTTPDCLIGWKSVDIHEIEDYSLNSFYESLGYFYKPSQETEYYWLINKDLVHRKRVLMSYDELKQLKSDILSYLNFKVDEIEKVKGASNVSQ